MSSRPVGRLAPFIRSWEILVMLRGRPRTLAEFAQHFCVSERTIRRDLEALGMIGFPITTTRDDYERPSRHAVWSLAAVPSWPLREHAPVAMLRMQREYSRGGRRFSVEAVR